MQVVFEVAPVDGVAVGKQYRVFTFIGNDFYFEFTQDIGPIQVGRDAAEAVGLALAAIHGAGFV